MDRLKNSAGAAGATSGDGKLADNLWEDNWDDDDIEDDFSVQLRCVVFIGSLLRCKCSDEPSCEIRNELEKKNGGDAMQQ